MSARGLNDPAPPRLSVQGRVLARNTIWNFASQATPVAIALVAVPILVRVLGASRFGVLSLIWVLVGYFSFFDFGFGRALTQLTAQRLGTSSEHQIAPLVWSYLFLTAFFGLLAAIVVAVGSDWLVHRSLSIPTEIERESVTAFMLMAISLPFAISTPGLRGCLEAYQRFDLVALLRLPSSLALVLGPLATLPFSKSLVPITAVLVGTRSVAWIAHFFVCRRVMPELKRPQAPRLALIRAMAGYAGWMTVSNVVAPLMAYLDRFLIGSMISAAAVAYYAAPYDLVTKLSIAPLAVTGVLFPAFAASFTLDPERAARLFSQGAKYVILLVLPPATIVAAFAEETLTLGLGASFAKEAGPVLKLMAVGVFINSFAQVPFSLIQGVGRPDLTAKLHLVELPFYLAILWLLTTTYGIQGAALAWDLRVLLDTAVMFWLARHLLSVPVAYVHHLTVIFAVGLVVLLAAAVMPFNWVTKVTLCLAAIPLFLVWVSARFLSHTEKMGIRDACLAFRGQKSSS